MRLTTWLRAAIRCPIWLVNTWRSHAQGSSNHAGRHLDHDAPFTLDIARSRDGRKPPRSPSLPPTAFLWGRWRPTAPLLWQRPSAIRGRSRSDPATTTRRGTNQAKVITSEWVSSFPPESLLTFTEIRGFSLHHPSKTSRYRSAARSTEKSHARRRNQSRGGGSSSTAIIAAASALLSPTGTSCP